MNRARRSLRFRRDHRWVPPHSSAYLDGELAVHDRRRVEIHVEDCPECRELLRSLRALIQALGTIPEDEGQLVAGLVLASVQSRLSEVPPDDR